MRIIQKIKSWFTRKKRRYEVVGFTTRSTQLSLAEWRQSKPMVSMAIKFLNDSEFQSMLDVLRNEMFRRYSDSFSNDVNELALTQCRMEGYATCLAKLESMGKFEEPSAERIETFEAQLPPSFGDTTTET